MNGFITLVYYYKYYIRNTVNLIKTVRPSRNLRKFLTNVYVDCFKYLAFNEQSGLFVWYP